MTPKELLYLEDALGHEQFMQTQCDECSSKLNDNDLKSFVSQLSQRHKDLFGQFYNQL